MITRIATALTVTVAALVLAIGAGAFVLSYDALQATGRAGGIPAGLAWLWPLLIDAPLVVFTLGLLAAQLTRQPIRLWAGLVCLYTLATVAFNLAHAQPTLLGWMVATVAPVGLLLTTEALRHLTRSAIERAATVASLAALTADLDRGRAELSELQAGIERDRIRISELKAELSRLRSEKKAESYQGASDDTRKRALQILAERSGDISGAELGRQLGRSDTLGRRLKNELLPIVMADQNGHQNGDGP